MGKMKLNPAEQRRLGMEASLPRYRKEGTADHRMAGFGVLRRSNAPWSAFTARGVLPLSRAQDGLQWVRGWEEHDPLTAKNAGFLETLPGSA